MFIKSEDVRDEKVKVLTCIKSMDDKYTVAGKEPGILNNFTDNDSFLLCDFFFSN